MEGEDDQRASMSTIYFSKLLLLCLLPVNAVFDVVTLLVGLERESFFFVF